MANSQDSSVIRALAESAASSEVPAGESSAASTRQSKRTRTSSGHGLVTASGAAVDGTTGSSTRTQQEQEQLQSEEAREQETRQRRRSSRAGVKSSLLEDAESAPNPHSPRSSRSRTR